MLEDMEELGISSIAAYLRSKGHIVMIIGTHVNLIDYKAISDFNAAVVGITVYGVTKSFVYQICEKLKNINKKTFICVGGIEATCNGTNILQDCSSVDFSIAGEGEVAMLSLVKAIENSCSYSNIEGLIYRSGNKIIKNSKQQYIENLDELPYPSRDILLIKKTNIAQISTSRGCMGNCSFCSSQLFWKKWRGRSPQNIVDEIELIVTQYHINMFSFIDSSFEDTGVETGRLEQIADEIINRKLFISYIVDFRADFHRHATSELMQKLKKSGLVSAMIVIESNNENDLKVFNKKASIEDNYKVMKLFNENGIVVKIGFINFNPYSTFEGLRKNIDFLELHQYALNFEGTASRYMMFKGTRLFDKLAKDNMLKNESSNEWGYIYQDQRIEYLSDYINDYIHSDPTLEKSFQRVRYYNPYYRIFISNCKRQFSLNKHEKGLFVLTEFLKIYELPIDGLCHEFNNKISNWFRLLLELAENNWDGKRASEISEKILSAEYVHKTASQLDKMKNNLYMNLVKLGPEYENYLINIS